MALKKKLTLEIIDLSVTPIEKVEKNLNKVLAENPYAQIEMFVLESGKLLVKIYEKHGENAVEREARELADTIVTELKQSLKLERPAKVIIPKERVQKLKEAIVGDNSSIGEVKTVKQ